MAREATELEIALVDVILRFRQKPVDAVATLRGLADEIEKEYNKAKAAKKVKHETETNIREGGLHKR